MGEEGATVDVANRVEPVAATDPQLVVDVQVAVGVDADRLQADALDARLAPPRAQELRRAHGAAALELDRHPAVLATHRRRLRPFAQIDTRLAKALRYLLAGERLLARDDPVGGLDQRHRRAERAPRLRHLDAHGSAAEDGEAVGDRLGRGGLARGPVLDFGQPLDRRHRRRRSRRDDDRPAGAHQIVANAHVPLTLDLAPAPEQLDAALGEPGELAGVVAVGDHLVAALERRPRIRVGALEALRRAADTVRLGERLGRAQQSLRRHARVVGAFAADQLALDDRHVEPAAGDPARADLAGRAGAEDDDIELASGHQLRSLAGLRPRALRCGRSTPGSGR